MPEKNLKQKTLSGMFWSFTDNFVNQGVNFAVGIILARVLSPKEFGLVGMLTIFITISQSFVDSGFSQALIRKKDCRQADYCTVFYFNLFIGALFYGILFFSAKTVSRFFNEPQLEGLIQVLGLVLIINAAGLIQNTILTKHINFKLQTRISVISSVAAGVISIWLAYNGGGVWSLVWRTLIQNFIRSSLLWVWNEWKPALLFSKAALSTMFHFGSKLLVSGLIDTTYKSFYYLIIGKFYSASQLGYYTRADNFQMFASSNLTNVVQRVSYPALSAIQDDDVRLKRSYKKLIKSTMLISFVLLIGMAATAKYFVCALVGEKWLPSVPYLQLLCFVGMLYPLHALNLNMLNVKGRSDLFLRLEVIKKVLAIPVILIGIFIGIEAMLVGMIINSIIAYFLNSFWSGKLINYPVKEQIRDIAPSFMAAIIMGFSVYALGFVLPYSSASVLFFQSTFGLLIIIVIGHIFRLGSYVEIRQVVMDKFQNKKV
ncbi:lipopolysaccharide biosynthesis protein [bacterium]|nr:lipopolysaccharide biosynthesis protein [bacterium]